jgi:tRNA(Arg) A34 adenosine deaminase TadA
MNRDKDFMLQAVQLSMESISRGGGPFGAVIVKDGVVVSSGINCVTLHNDPTAHAEIIAIRSAALKLGTFNLKGCEIYTSCEPCPMCLSAIYWARLDKIYYANTKTDASAVGFDDSFIYDELKLKPEERHLPSEQMLREEAIKAFKAWQIKEDKTEY